MKISASHIKKLMIHTLTFPIRLHTKKDNQKTSTHWLIYWFGYGLGAALLIDSSLTLQQIFFPSAPSAIFTTLSPALENMIGWLLGVLFCLQHLPKPWHQKRSNSAKNLSALHIVRYRVTFWIGCTFFLNALIEGIYTYRHLWHIPLFVPDWPISIRLLQYPFLLLAILSLPNRPHTSSARLRVVLDGVLIMTTLITFSWYFLFGPVLLHGNTTSFDTIVAVAFPCGDVVLCWCLLRLSFHHSEPQLQLARRLFLLGLVGIIIGDSILEYQIVQGTLPISSAASVCQQVGNTLGYILIALAVLAVNTTNNRASQSTDETIISSELVPALPLWRVLLPYSVVPAIGLLLLVVWYTQRNGPLASGVYLGGFILIIQIMLRQIIVLCETWFTNQKLRKTQQALNIKNEALNEANIRLEELATELTYAYKQQRQANELKDQFLLSVNHELRTPLTEIYGYLDLLSEYQGYLDAPKQAIFLAHALHASEELLQLVNTVLDALRSEKAVGTLEYEAVPVSAAVQRAVDLFEPEKRYTARFCAQIPDHLVVHADRQHLHQILCNLLSNAFKYSPDQTTVIVSAQEEPAVSVEMASPQICIQVQDAGPGIPPDDLPLLFGKFVRLKRDLASKIRGTGLGLYVSKQLVEAMGGRIWVESSGIVGEGSRFCVLLPAVPEDKSVNTVEQIQG